MSTQSPFQAALRFSALLANLEYKDWSFYVGSRLDGMLYLQVSFIAPDNDAPGHPPCRQQGRKWLLSPHMTDSEFIQTAFKAVLTAEEHEARELFMYKGVAPFAPHFDVEELVKLAASGHTDTRKTPKKEEE